MLKKIVLSLLILSIVGALILFFFGSSILSKSIKTVVETAGSKVTQTPVRLEEVKLSVLSGDGQLSGLFVGNPEGFKSENIFALGQIEIDLETSSLRTDQIVINKIYIKEPFISYEKTLRTSNLKELLKNIEESTGGGDDAAVEEEPQPEDSTTEEESAPGKDVLIKEFVIEKPNVFLGLMGAGANITLPSIHLNDISSSEEKIAATILNQVIAELLNGIKNTVGSTGDVGGDIINSANDSLKGVNDSIKNLFGK